MLNAELTDSYLKREAHMVAFEAGTRSSLRSVFETGVRPSRLMRERLMREHEVRVYV